MTHKTAAPGVSFRSSATLTAIYRAITCMLCLCSLEAAYAQGMRLTPSPAVTMRVPVESANGVVPVAVQANYIVAIVNSEPVTSTEVRARLIRYEQRLAAMGTPLPSRIDLTREVLEDVINEKIQLQRARDTNVRVDDRTIDAAVQNFANQNKVSVAELRARSSADGIGFTQIRSDIQNQLLIQKLRERDVLGNIDISDNEIEAFFKSPAGYGLSGELVIDIAQILVAVPENATEAQVQTLRERATRIYNRAINGGDFYKLAQENSDAKDARIGGQMGLRSIDRYPTLFSEAVKDKKVADVVGPIKSGAGFHVLQLLAKQAPLSSSEQRETARNTLREKKFDDAYANWIRDLRSNAYVEYRDLQQ
jgi:peptidyl-prolyl cis-trans isomerase SurA